MGVGEAVIDCLQSSRAAIGEVAELDGGGFAGEGEEAVVTGVEGEVDQDIDLVAADLVGQIRVGESSGFAPDVGVGFQLRCQLV